MEDRCHGTIPMVSLGSSLSFYLIRNQEGKFFRAKGFSGHGDTWVANVQDAKVYLKLGQARSRVTFFTKNYPEFGTPEILVVTTSKAEVLDEKKRVAKAIQKIQDKKLAREQARLQAEQDRLNAAQRKINAQRDKLKADRKKMEEKHG